LNVVHGHIAFDFRGHLRSQQKQIKQTQLVLHLKADIFYELP